LVPERKAHKGIEDFHRYDIKLEIKDYQIRFAKLMMGRNNCQHSKSHVLEPRIFPKCGTEDAKIRAAPMAR
jgi:hypothetical protein